VAGGLKEELSVTAEVEVQNQVRARRNIVVQGDPNNRTSWAAVFNQLRDTPMSGHGGKRPGAGRPKGAASRANEQVRQEAAATGELPLAYMLRIMRDPSQPVGRRDDMAKAAAPFCHSRLSSVEHSGEISRPTVIRAPAISATLDEWQTEYAPGAKEQH
jgi:hypothetical protein